MLGLVTNDGEAVAIHRTYLTADGCKAPMEQVKKITKTSGSMSGACIQLGAPQRVDSPRRRQLGVAEGIEIGLGGDLGVGHPDGRGDQREQHENLRAAPGARRSR